MGPMKSRCSRLAMKGKVDVKGVWHLAGHFRIFSRDPYRLVYAYKIEPASGRLRVVCNARGR